MTSELSLAGAVIAAAKASGLAEGRVYRELVDEPVPLVFDYMVVSDYIADTTVMRGDDQPVLRARQLQLDYWQAYDDDDPASLSNNAEELRVALDGYRVETRYGFVTLDVVGIARLNEDGDRVSRHTYTIRVIYEP